jgi:LysR family transcriptional regulator of gallate degradation
LTLGDLRTAAWILPPRDVNAHQQWRNAFILAGIEPPRHCVETASLAAARALLLSSDGVALLAQQVVELEKRLGLLTVLPIELPSTTRAIGITTRARAALPEVAGRLIANIRDVAMQYVAKSERQAARRQFAAPVKAKRWRVPR